MDFWIIALLILASAVGAAVIYVALRKTGAQLADMRALAQTQGWGFEHAPATFKQGATTTFTSKDADWTLSYCVTSDQGRAIVKQLTWHSPMHALAEGTVILRPFTAQSETTPPFVARLIKGLLLRSNENLDALAPNIKPVAGSALTGLVMATPGQETGLDALHPHAAAALKNQAELTVIRDTTGITLRKRTGLKSMDQITDLVSLGCTLRAAFDA